MHATYQEISRLMSDRQASALTGISRTTPHRYRHKPHGAARKPGPQSTPHALSTAERQRILEVCTAKDAVDKSVAQVYHRLLDTGTYIASMSSMYRVLRADKLVGDRRAQATHPPRVKPELHATGPDQVHSWDITKLSTSVRGKYYNAYVMMDVWSRRLIHVEVHETETADLAQRFMRNAIINNGGVIPDYVHSDNGSPMTGKTMREFLHDCGIKQSLSRPRVSNDNPFSESNFKTLKYAPAYPDQFHSLQEAHEYMLAFQEYYNNCHYHKGIAYFTPQSVHDGSWRAVHAERQQRLNTAYANHPGRFLSGPPVVKTPPTDTWINKPTPPATAA